MRRFICCFIVVLFYASAPLEAQWFPVPDAFLPPPVVSDGSPQARLWANIWSARDGIERLTNSERNRLIKKKELVSLSQIKSLDVHSKLEPSKRYLLYWAADALGVLAEMYAQEVGSGLPLNSALRTVEQQKALLPRKVKRGRRWVWVGNMNAIPPWGLFGSAHPYGNTVDLARFRIPDWYEPRFEAVLLRLEAQGCLDVTKESGQAVFHVTFFKRCRVGATTIAAALDGME